jgi:hypothetical protein
MVALVLGGSFLYYSILAHSNDFSFFVEFHSITHQQINWLALTGEPLPITQ